MFVAGIIIPAYILLLLFYSSSQVAATLCQLEQNANKYFVYTIELFTVYLQMAQVKYFVLVVVVVD